MKALVTAAFLTVLASGATARDLPADPMRSVMWEEMAEQHFSSGPIVFDERVRLLAPAHAENQMMVPLTVDARDIADVEEIVIVADLNPIQKAVAYTVLDAEAFLSVQIKLEQSSPIRVGVRTRDGTWHMNGQIVDAAGGGCTAPAAAHSTANWVKTLGQTKALARREGPDAVRVRFSIKHPMDTGLADGIPVFHLNQIDVASGGKILSRFELFEPISENPSIAIMPRVDAREDTISFSARDTEGNQFRYNVAVPQASSL